MLKSSDETIGISAPKKPRSVKRSHECRISGSGGGEVGDVIPPEKPTGVIVNPPPPPSSSSSSVYVRKKKRSTSPVKPSVVVAAPSPPPSITNVSVGEKMVYKPTVVETCSKPRKPRSASGKRSRECGNSDGGGEAMVSTSPVKLIAVTAPPPPPSVLLPSSSDVYVGEKMFHPQAASSTVKPTVVAAPSEPLAPVSPSSNVSVGKKMSKKRGLSLEEKREKMLQIFYDSQDFYLLKELEKIGPKKGVISQSVKDVIQSLVDDDLVLKDKIGSSVYFWSLASCAGNQLRNASNKLESDIKSSKTRLAELIEQRDAFKKGREASDERDEALADLKTVEIKYNELKNEMGHYSDNDPAALEAMKNATGVSHAAANRWTDNIFAVQQWCSNNIPHAKEQLQHLYTEIGITENFDYLEPLEPEPAQPDSCLGPHSIWTPLSIIK
ncbi:hypothetical protein MKX03_007403 [Papaver bracteatum]|nr:hypothetical protein MKX03_007403 [Papaver bracteatum]